MIAKSNDAFGNFDFFELAVVFDERAVFDHEKAVDLVLMQMDGLRADVGCLGNVCGDVRLAVIIIDGLFRDERCTAMRADARLVRAVYFDVCAALRAFGWNQWHVFLPLRYFR